MILAGTGHRPEKLGGYFPNPLQEWVKARIRETLTRLKPERCISGMAVGFDQWLAEACIDQGVPFIAAVPFAGQESTWPWPAKENYRRLLCAAARVVIVTDGGYEAWKMGTRNVWMVEQSSHLLACWDGTEGGTANCFRSAEQRGRSVKDGTIILIDPNEFKAVRLSEDPW